MYKKKYLWLIFIWIIFLLFLVIRLIFSTIGIQNNLERQRFITGERNSSDSQWNSNEIEKLEKEINWLEQQLQVSKSDSFSLGLNLHDSIVQVQLKGTVLIRSKIMKQYPENAYNRINKNYYSELFGKVTYITWERANMQKKPIRKVKVSSSDEEEKDDILQDLTIKNVPLFWQFKTADDLKIAIFGTSVSKDSVLNFRSFNNILKARLKEFLEDPIFNYSPTLYIWIDDKDAKAIYRAVSENGHVILRD